MTGIVPQYVEQQRLLKGRRFRVRRAPRGRPPGGVERDYRAYLRRLVNAVRDDIAELLLPIIPPMLREATGRLDAPRYNIADVEGTLAAVSEELTARLDNRHLRGLEQSVAEYQAATSAGVTTTLRRQIRRMISLDAFPPVGTMERVLVDGFTRQNVKLIKSLTGDYVSQVEDMVRRGVQAGDRASVIQGQIEGRWEVTQSKARLIARDQIGKLQGSLTRVRQESLGLSQYIWRTSRDERVRESHLQKEGSIFKWSEPPPDTGHPGQDYQCRCTAEPYIAGEPPPVEDVENVKQQVREKRARLKERMKARR